MIVLVPDEVGERTLADVDGLHVIRYHSATDLVTLGTDAEVLIPGFRPSDDTSALLERLPRLRLVQLLSAGAERWVHRVPAGVELSDCRGAHGALTAEWVLAGLLAMLREFPAFLRNQNTQQWERRASDTLLGKRILTSVPATSRIRSCGASKDSTLPRSPKSDVPHGPGSTVPTNCRRSYPRMTSSCSSSH